MFNHRSAPKHAENQVLMQQLYKMPRGIRNEKLQDF